jgi:hypothetical protein
VVLKDAEKGRSVFGLRWLKFVGLFWISLKSAVPCSFFLAVKLTFCGISEVE